MLELEFEIDITFRVFNEAWYWLKSCTYASSAASVGTAWTFALELYDLTRVLLTFELEQSPPLLFWREQLD